MLRKFPTSSCRHGYKSHKFKTWNTISSENTIDLKSRRDPGYKAAYSHSSSKLIINPYYWGEVRVVIFSSNLIVRVVDFQGKKNQNVIFYVSKKTAWIAWQIFLLSNKLFLATWLPGWCRNINSDYQDKLARSHVLCLNFDDPARMSADWILQRAHGTVVSDLTKQN